MSLLAILLFIGTMALSLWATIRVRQVYNRFSLLRASSGSTGADTAATILRQEGISDVEIVAHDQMLGDHYDPIHKRVVLSRENFHGTSVAALGVAAHECGHAIQHREAYAPLQWRMASVGLTTFASQIVLWLPLLGMFTGFLNTGMALVLMASAWGILMLFNLITLPVEFDASARARLVLRQTGLIRTVEEETAREGIACSSLDLCCRVYYVARLLFAARVASARGTQRVIHALPQNRQQKGPCTY
jgi:Zn-dependent membrane protease YugP